jgi:signal transduction histidine kinase
MKNNKQLIFCFFSFVGGIAGAILSKPVLKMGVGSLPIIAYSSMWSVVAAALSAVALFAVGEIYNRKKFTLGIYLKATIAMIIAGAIGGFVGSVGFLIASNLFAEALGRMLGFGLIGAALGIAVVAIQEMFRSAKLEVLWAPKGEESITLGKAPVYNGVVDDHFYIHGITQNAMSIIIETGKIHCIGTA